MLEIPALTYARGQLDAAVAQLAGEHPQLRNVSEVWTVETLPDGRPSRQDVERYAYFTLMDDSHLTTSFTFWERQAPEQSRGAASPVPRSRDSVGTSSSLSLSLRRLG